LFSGSDKVAFITIHMGSDILELFTTVIQARIYLVPHKYNTYTHTHTHTHTHTEIVDHISSLFA
jgi:hypothetical protein